MDNYMHDNNYSNNDINFKTNYDNNENNLSTNYNLNENNNLNEYVNNKYYSKTFENFIFVLWIMLWGYMIFNIIMFIQYCKRPQFQYRGIAVTLLFGVSATAYVLLILAARIYNYDCICRVWITNIFIVLTIFSLMSKGIRIIYLWKLNCYKLSNTKKSNTISLNGSSYEPEANTYFKAVYKFINKIANRMIILPIVIDLIITGITSFIVKDNCNENPFSFAPIIIFSIIFTFVYPYLIYQLHKVHEYHKFTTEKEYIITMILWVIIFSLYGVFTFVPKYKNNEAIQYYTNKGTFLFVIQQLIGFIIIMNVPFIEMIHDKKKFLDFNEDLSIEYFYKLINDSTVIEELKEVAISEFSIENVLFWESYRELMKLTKYKKENAIKKIINGINNVHKSIKPNGNIMNILVANEQSDGYDDERKFYNNYEQRNVIREMEVYPNNYYGNRDYDYGRSNSSKNLLEEYKRAEDMNNDYACTYRITTNHNVDDNRDQYNFDIYNQKQGQRRRSIKQCNISVSEKSELSEKSGDNSSSSSEVSADTPVPVKYYNYYQNFYNIFINVNSTAAVNINCSVRQLIESNIKNPKIGIFDEAKDEVILLMYRNLCPKLVIQLKEKEMI